MNHFRFHNFIWQVDGIIFNTTPALTYTFSKALGELGVPLPMDRINALVRHFSGGCIRALADEARVDFQVLETRFSQIYAGISPFNQPVISNVVPVLRSVMVQGGVNVIVSRHDFVSTMRLLFFHQITNYFQDIFASSDGISSQSEPDLIQPVVTRNDFDPQTTLLIGKNQFDVQAAKDTGICVCLVRPDSELSGADFIVDEFDQLSECFQQMEEMRTHGMSRR